MNDPSNTSQPVESFDVKMLGSDLYDVKSAIGNAKKYAKSAIERSQQLGILGIDNDIDKILKLMEQAQIIMDKPKVQEYTGSDIEVPF